jgi:hypothetical protein
MFVIGAAAFSLWTRDNTAGHSASHGFRDAQLHFKVKAGVLQP